VGVRRCSRVWIWAAVTVCVLGAGPVRVEQRTWLVLHVDTLRVGGQGTEVLGTDTLALDGREDAVLERERVAWPPFSETGRFRLDATGRAATSGDLHSVQVHTRFELAGKTFEGEREFAMREGSSYLMEAFAHEGQRLVAALRVETESGPVVIQAATVGQRIGFELEVARMTDNRAIPLETNQLNTFVGEAVEYSFRRGAGAELETLLLRLRPVRIDHDLAEVEFELSGSLPGLPSRLVLDRRELLYTSRNATSSIEVTAGAPVEGYRFRVTPRF